MSRAAGEMRSGLALLFGAEAPEPDVAAPEPVDVEAVRAEGFAAGWAAGLAEGEARTAPLRERLEAAVAAFAAARAVDAETLTPVFAQLARRLAEAVVGGELRLDAAVLERLAHAALEMAGPGEAALRVHPEDAALLREAGIGVALVEDMAMARGELVAEGGDWVVAEGLAARLAGVLGSALGPAPGETGEGR